LGAYRARKGVGSASTSAHSVEERKDRVEKLAERAELPARGVQPGADSSRKVAYRNKKAPNKVETAADAAWMTRDGSLTGAASIKILREWV
jgi:hypothetical protein